MIDSIMKKIQNKDLEDFCRKNQIKSLSLFGSVLRNDFNPISSDIDILVEFDKGYIPGLFKFSGIELELRNMIHEKVDLKTLEDISIYFRNEIQNSAKKIFEFQND